MPPKAKKPSQPTSQANPTPESCLSIPSQASKIPTNRPLYRRTLVQDITHIRPLKVKLWKLHSLKLNERWNPQSYAEIYGPRGPGMYPKLSSRTMKKCISPIKQLGILKYDGWRRTGSFRKLRFRLDRLELHFSPLTPESAKRITRMIHHGVKDFSVGSESRLDPRRRGAHEVLLRHFTRLEKLDHCTESYREFRKIRLPVCSSLKKVVLNEGWVKDCEGYLVQYWPNVQDLTLSAYYKDPTVFKFLPGLSSQKLQKLHLNITSNEDVGIDFSPLKICQNLKILILNLHYVSVQGFEELIHHLSLQELSFTQGVITHNFESNKSNTLGSLQKLRLASSWLDGDSAQDLSLSLLSQAKNIKALELAFSLQDLGEFVTVPEPTMALDRLQIEIKKVSLPFASPLKALVAFLKRQTNLKELDLHLCDSYKDLLEGILKAISAKAPLEKLRVKLGKASELQDMKVPSIKDFIGKFIGLKEVSLDLETFVWDARDLTSFVGVFMKLKSLERFELNVGFGKVTDAANDKFMDFVKSMKHLKKLEIKIDGNLVDYSYRVMVQSINSS